MFLLDDFFFFALLNQKKTKQKRTHLFYFWVCVCCYTNAFCVQKTKRNFVSRCTWACACEFVVYLWEFDVFEVFFFCDLLLFFLLPKLYFLFFLFGPVFTFIFFLLSMCVSFVNWKLECEKQNLFSPRPLVLANWYRRSCALWFEYTNAKKSYPMDLKLSCCEILGVLSTKHDQVRKKRPRKRAQLYHHIAKQKYKKKKGKHGWGARFIRDTLFKSFDSVLRNVKNKNIHAHFWVNLN